MGEYYSEKDKLAWPTNFENESSVAISIEDKDGDDDVTILAISCPYCSAIVMFQEARERGCSCG